MELFTALLCLSINYHEIYLSIQKALLNLLVGTEIIIQHTYPRGETQFLSLAARPLQKLLLLGSSDSTPNLLLCPDMGKHC